MKRVSIVLVALLILSAGLYGYLAHVPAADDKSGLDLLNWPPNAAEICKLAGTNGADPRTREGFLARSRYLDLFKKRYRGHNPMMAVGIRFQPSGRIDLLTPARMEPWSLDQLAVNTFHETQQAFGHPFDIDLFITYIGAPPLKIGELRRAKDSLDKLEIVHYSKAVYIRAEQAAPVKQAQKKVGVISKQPE